MALEDYGASFVMCPACSRRTTPQNWRAHLQVCPSCGAHQPISAPERLASVLDAGSFVELGEHIEGSNPLDFPGYDEKLSDLRRKTGLQDAVITGLGMIDGVKVVIGVMDSRFMMGSMGTAVGERVTLAVEYARHSGLPLVLFCASGGARMQEGIFSLMQMAKTSAAIADFSADGGLYISVLTHPTTGGMIASFASLGDITIAEPGALIGFAGPRVIEQTIGQRLPEGFQRSEFQQDHGFVDQIVQRGRMRETLSQLLRLHGYGVMHG
ncbi:MAG: acetyl-CoA carboxylase carboxyltransferase subunit beta [Clostridia bacterium]|nr:acetyl-CoA carboxylase carboxyltransferase subunit beta [Clostridia bacterium]